MADPQRRPLILIAFAFEASLGVLGLVIATFAGLPLAQQLWPDGRALDAVGLGLVATLPMVILLWILLRSRARAVVDLLRKLKGLLRVLFTRGRTWHVAAIALTAGFGEEILFRGAIQPLVVAWWGPATGLVVASLLFGIVHAASPTYFAFATLIGFYLGGLALWSGEILSASLAHALYDYIAIETLRARLLRSPEAPSSIADPSTQATITPGD